MWRRSSALMALTVLATATGAHAQSLGRGGASNLASDLSRWSVMPARAAPAPGAGAAAEFQLGEAPAGAERLRLGPDGRSGQAGGTEGRWFLFAGARRSELGAGSRSGDEAWRSAGWADESASASMTSAEAGIALRKGQAQASFGYVKRKFKVSGAQSDLLANMPKSDHVAGFSFSYTLR